MKILILIAWSFCTLFSISIDEISNITLKHSYKVDAKKLLIEALKQKEKKDILSFLPNISLNYIYSFNAPANRDPYNLNTTNITGTYNLFNGFKDYYTYKKSLNLIQKEENSLRILQSDILLALKSSYINALKAKEQIKVASNTLDLLQAQLNKANQFLLQGLDDKSAVLSVEINLANIKLKQSKAILELNSNLRLLSKLSGIDFKENMLEEIDINKEINLDEDKILEGIYLKNLRLKELNFSSFNLSYESLVQDANLYPKLELNATKFWYFTGASNASTTYGLQSQIRLNLSYNFLSGANSYVEHQIKKLEYLSLRQEINDLKLNLKEELLNALEEISIAKKELSLAKLTLIKASENYRIINNKYKQNIAKYTELLDAQLLLNNTKSAIVTSKYNIILGLQKINYLESNNL